MNKKTSRLSLVKRKLVVNARLWVVPMVTFFAGTIFWLVLALNTHARDWVSVRILDFPDLPSGALLFAAVVLLMFSVALYFFLDYRQHQRPFRQENNASAYAPTHHAKVVFLPRLLFNWKQSFYWLAYSLASLLFIVTVTVSKISPVYASGPYSGPHGSDVFAMLVKTDEPNGNSGNNQFTFDMILASPNNWERDMNFSVDCDNDGTWEFTNYNDAFTCTYPIPGTYTIAISGLVTRIHAENYWWNDSKKILEIQQWGNTPWEFLYLGGATNMNITANDAPNLSNGTSLAGTFADNTTFNGNINNWDVSNVRSISSMFRGATSFNQPLDSWDTSKIEYTSWAFAGATSFNQPLDSWDTSSVTDMTGMFSGAVNFNQPLSSWDTSNVTNMGTVFGSGGYPSWIAGATSFNQPLDSWDTSSVTDMTGMFSGAVNFNQPLSSWDTSNVTNMSGMFENATSFNYDINTWNTSGVVAFNGVDSWGSGGMFENATSFNQPLDSWDTSGATTMKSMFAGATSFNQPLGSWNTASVTDMTRMFSGATSFNQNINNWDTSNVTSMSGMFGSWNYPYDGAGATSFNQPLDSWDTSKVTIMYSMFAGATSFNQPLDSWDTSKVTNMSSMFAGATAFDGSISAWDTSSLEYMNASGSSGPGMFENATSFNQNINGWNVSKVTNMTRIFKNAGSFNGPIGSWNTGATTSMSEMFSGATSFNQPLNNWDTSKVTSMDSMFSEAGAFNQPLNNWDTSNVVSMYRIFYNAHAFNGAVGNWDTSKVTNISAMFAGATSFNQPIGTWDVGGFESFDYMFQGATSFNQPLNNWDTSKVTNMSEMFAGATSFNQPLNNWDTSKVTIMREMFAGATAFNQPVGSWNTASLYQVDEMFKDSTSFDQSIGNWNIENLAYLGNIFEGSGISPETYDAILSGWSEQNLKENVTFYPYNLMFCDSANSRSHIITEFHWSIAGDSYVCPPEVNTGPVQSVSSRQATVLVESATASNSVIGVEYGDDTSYGYSAYSYQPGSSEQPIDIDNLNCGTTYHYRGFASNARGLAQGQDKTFATPDCNDYALTIKLNNTPPVVKGDVAEYELSVKNLGPSTSTSPFYFYIILPEDTTYSTAVFVGADPASSCTDYGLASSLPYGSFSSYNNRLIVCAALPEQAMASGSSFSMKVQLAVTADFVPDATILRGLAIAYFDDSEVDTLSTAIIGSSPLYSLNSNNIYNHVYRVTKDDPKQPKDPDVDPKPDNPTVVQKNTPSTPAGKPDSFKGLPSPIEYLEQLARNAKNEDRRYLLSGKTAVVIKNLPWVLLLGGSLLYMSQAYKQLRQNTILRKNLAVTTQTREGIEGFLHIVTHYLATPITIISLTIEAASKKSDSGVTSSLQRSSENLKTYVNGLIANLNAQASTIKSELTTPGKITRKSIIRWVVAPSVIAVILTVIGLAGMAGLGVWSTTQDAMIFTGVMLVASIGLTITFFQVWQNQRQLNADLANTNLIAEKALKSRVAFVAENQRALMTQSQEVEAVASIERDGVSQSFMKGVAQLKKVATAFSTVTKIATTGATDIAGDWTVTPFLQEFQKQADSKGVNLFYDGPEQARIWLPKSEMTKIASIIIGNAIQFTSSGGSVKIALSSTGSSLSMIVEDTGIGIEKDKLVTLMQPFSRGTSTETYDFEGLGLNLYLARLIAEKHSGSIKIESKSGAGTKVTIQV